MHIKIRGKRAMLYRSSWVAKGANGNTHGYSIQTFAGSLPIHSEALPAGLTDKLSTDELNLLETKLFQPARQAAQEKAREAEHLESDPLWRLDEATRLTLEAAERSERGYVPNSRVAAVQAALSRVKTITPVPTHAPSQTVAHTGAQVPASGQSKGDPLNDALIAIKTARDAVLAGRYGTAPTDKARATHAYQMWAEIFEAIEGTKGTSLLRALQGRGFVKTREVRARR